MAFAWLDHEIDKFGSQLDWKSKTQFFTFLNEYVSWIEWDKILISQISPPKFRYFTDENRPKEGPHENELWHFSFLEVICLVMVLKLTKIVHFCKFVLTSGRNLNLLKQFIYIHLKDLMMLFQKILCFIGVWATVYKILRNKISKKYWFNSNLTKFINFKRQCLLNSNS